jgi:ketosteroid isomerase-like protein
LRARLGDTARMSVEETLRAFYQAFNLHDFDGVIELMAPEVEIHPALGGVLDIEGEYRGQEESRRFFETISEGAHVEVELKEIVDLGDDQVLAIESWRPRVRQGMETEIEVSDLYTFRDGLIVRVVGFRDRAEALEAANSAE